MNKTSEGRLNDLAGAEINILLLGGEKGLERLSEQERIDSKTPFYRESIERDLSVQQRKILMSILRHGVSARIKDIANFSRLFQQNKTSAQIGVMVKKGYLERLEDGTYFISSQDPDLLRFLQLRYGDFSIN